MQIQVITHPSQDAIEQALRFIPPTIGRDEWLKVGMAVKSQLREDGFPLWDGWSRGAANYDERAALATWRSIQPAGRVGVGTLFYTAKQYGYRPDPSKRVIYQRPQDPPLQRPDLRHIALNLELHALALEERAKAVLRASTCYDAASLSDSDVETGLQTVLRAHKDMEHAQVLLDVADGLRLRAWKEGL